MNPQPELKERILSAAREEFFRFGFTRVSVDEIASKLGVSKKTVYKYFSSKDDLVREATNSALHEMATSCREIVEESGAGVVDKLRRMMTLVALQYAKIGRPLLDDLQKNAPHIWETIAKGRMKVINSDFRKILDEGIRHGVFRRDLEGELIMTIYRNLIQAVLNPGTLTELPYSPVQVFDAVVKVIYEGILTDKGRSKFVVIREGNKQKRSL